MSSYLYDQVAELEGKVYLLENRVNRLEEDLRRAQAALLLAVDALGRLGEPLDVRLSNEPPAHLQDWKMKPLDE